MREYLEIACEEIDAAVFSGDFLLNDEEQEEFKRYLSRWHGQVLSAEEEEEEEEDRLDDATRYHDLDMGC